MSDRFDEFKAAYPKRAGTYKWPLAYKLCLRVTQSGDATWDDLIAGAERYKRFVQFTGRERSEFVMMPSTWLGDNTQGWTEDYELPIDTSKPRALTDDQKRELALIRQGNEEGLTRAPGESLDSFSARIRRAYIARVATPAEPTRQPAGPSNLQAMLKAVTQKMNVTDHMAEAVNEVRDE